MIIDHIRNALFYNGVNEGIRRALEYLVQTDCAGIPLGRVNLEGDKLFALVQEYETKSREQGVWEAHRRYIDVQYVAMGIEIMGYAPLDSLAVSQPYAGDKDVVLLNGTGSDLIVPAKTFVVFFPEDAHMPGLAHETPAHVRKVVVKVAVD